MNQKIRFTIVTVLYAMYLMAGTEAKPVDPIVPLANVAEQVAYQGAVLQHQIASNVNQIANQVTHQANVALHNAQVQQAQIAHAANTIASQTVG